MSQREVAAGHFKAHCLQLMDDVRTQRVPLVITKRGKPVARLVPIEAEPATLFGALQGTITFHGDVVAPIDEPWHADG